MASVLTHRQITPVGCVLGCVNAATGQSWDAEPHQLVCRGCTDRLTGDLRDIEQRCALLADADNLLPTSSGQGGSPGYGSRSPAVDGLLAHLDVRTRHTDDGGYGALAVLESWTRMLRWETKSKPPTGRATITRELGTIRHHWPYLLAAPWVDEFAAEITELVHQLRALGELKPGTGPAASVRVGECRAPFEGGVCGASLRVRVGAMEIVCRRCHTVWPRHRWGVDLGDPWTDYAALHEDLGVPLGTLHRWASEDGWELAGTRGRRLVYRADALASFRRRRGELIA